MALPYEGGVLPAYAWPGGYPILYVSGDGSEWCADCANQDDAEPKITDWFVFYEGQPVNCAGCATTVESAYGDPDEALL